MLQKVQQNKWLRLGMGVLGGILMAAGINLIVVPQGMYSGGLYGLCQVIRTLLVTALGLETSVDLAGIFYLLVNLPLIVLAWRTLGRDFVVGMTTVTIINSIALAVIPSPTTPIIADKLTSCLVGGIISGFSGGIILTCGCSTGGLDVLGLYLSKKGKGFTGWAGFSHHLQHSAVRAVRRAVRPDHRYLFRHLRGVSGTVSGSGAPAEHLRPDADLHQGGSRAAEPDHSGKAGSQLHPVGGPGRLFPRSGACAVRVSQQVRGVSVQMALSEIDPHAFTIIQEGIRVGGNFGRHLSS